MTQLDSDLMKGGMHCLEKSRMVREELADGVQMLSNLLMCYLRPYRRPNSIEARPSPFDP